MSDLHRCRVRSRAAGQPAPCRESQVSPGTCVWCFARIDAALITGSDPPITPRNEGELDYGAFLAEVMRAERVTRAKGGDV